MGIFDGERLRQRRQARGQSIRELAEAIDRPPEIIKKLEHGEVKASPITLGTLCVALSCRVTDLLDDSDLTDDPRPSDLGREIDAWIREALAAMPDMDEEAARRTSAAMYPE